MALIQTKVPNLQMLSIKLDTKKRELEAKGVKHTLNKDVSDVISMLIDEINTLNTFYEAFAEANRIGQS